MMEIIGGLVECLMEGLVTWILTGFVEGVSARRGSSRP